MVERRRIRLVRQEHRDRAAFDTAVSRALLLQASAGEVPETLRLHVPGPVVAFGRRDTLDAGYAAAVAAARAGGFAAVERLAGGRAAVFTDHTIAFAWTIPDPDPRTGISARFTALAEIMVRAFAGLGVAAAIGEIPGEYCPGDYSVHHDRRIKLMGVGQRLARNAAHVGGVVVVDRSDQVRNILLPVYGALGLPWDPATAGALGDVVPGITPGDTIAAIVAEFEAFADVAPATLDPPTLALADRLAAEHEAPVATG